jgi:DNA polymerase-3 subunit beta
MKLICSQSELNAHLSLVSRIVPSRPEPLVLGNILLVAETETQKVSLTAFDGSLGIRTTFNAEVEEGGKITLPAKLFNDIVSRLPEMEISLEANESDEEEESIVATLSSASGLFQLRGINSSQFPVLPVIQEGEEIQIPVSMLLVGLRGCLFAASTELSKQILTGVHLKTQTINQDVVEFAATDSHRLAVVESMLEPLEEENLENGEGRTEKGERRRENEEKISHLPPATSPASPLEFPSGLSLTIPARALRELERAIASYPSTETIKLRFDDSQLIFELANQRLTSLRLTGAYPAYEQLIPRQFSRSMVVERKRLLISLELVSVLAQKSNIVKFSLNSDRGELSLSVDAKDLGNARESISAEIIGENIDIAFNIKYLMDGLKALSATEIKMQLNEWNQPVIFTPLGGVKMTYLVMPVQIRN